MTVAAVKFKSHQTAPELNLPDISCCDYRIKTNCQIMRIKKHFEKKHISTQIASASWPRKHIFNSQATIGRVAACRLCIYTCARVYVTYAHAQHTRCVPLNEQKIKILCIELITYENHRSSRC